MPHVPQVSNAVRSLSPVIDTFADGKSCPRDQSPRPILNRRAGISSSTSNGRLSCSTTVWISLVEDDLVVCVYIEVDGSVIIRMTMRGPGVLESPDIRPREGDKTLISKEIFHVRK